MLRLEDYHKDIEFCIRCGECRSECPVLEQLSWESVSMRGKLSMLYEFLNGKILFSDNMAERIYTCPLCGHCEASCLYVKNLIRIMEVMRSYCVKAGYGLPGKQKAFGVHVAKEHNPYMELHKDRCAWLPSDIRLSEKSETVYFVGCTASYRQKELAKATVNVFKKAGVDFTILKDEWCCASPLLRTGQWQTNWVSVKNIARHNIREAEKVGAERIVTTCAGCYRTWKIDYLDEEYGKIFEAKHNFEILHTMEVLEKLIKDGEIEFKKEIKMEVTYHDPCHLGRHARLYDPPRNVLKAIPGISFIEMSSTSENARCCGAGGGFLSGFHNISLAMAQRRVRDAEEVKAKAMATACPFCVRNLREGAINAHIKIYDIIELVNEAMG